VNNITLLKSIGNIKDKYIEEANPLNNIDLQKKHRINGKQRILSLAGVLAAAAVLFVLFNTYIYIDQNESGVTVENPMYLCKDIDEAESIVGFTLNVPDSILGSQSRQIYVIDQNIIEIDYFEGQDIIACIKKAKSTEDISGDYSVYENEEIRNIGDVEATFKGNDNLIYLVTWSNGEYSYSISINNGVEESDIFDILVNTY